MNELIQEQFNLKVTGLKKLNGYYNVNYLITTAEAKFIFKTYTYSDELIAIVEAENDTLLFLQANQNHGFPTPIPFKDDTYVKKLQIDGKETICRLLSYLEGSFLGAVNHTPEVVKSLGTFLAKTDIALIPFKNYIIKSRQFEWDIQHLHLNKKYIDAISKRSDRKIVEYYFQQFEENVIPVLPELRKSIIHNDANEWNILVTDGVVSGLIDFGDLTYTPLINELAIAITYVCYDKENYLEWASLLIMSYHKVLPIKKEELSILYYLIAARLCTSICNAAHSRKINPKNTYASSSEKSAWKMLYGWLRMSPTRAKNSFLLAAGYTLEKPDTLEKVINRRHQIMSPVLSLSYDAPIYMERSAFQYMYDAYGNTFLDGYNNIPHVGHCHPKVVAAGKKQLSILNTNTRYLYSLLADYAEKLLSKFPSALNKVYFVNSGSAASDLAIRIALQYTKHKKVMVMEHGYHGITQIGIDISDFKFNNSKGQGQKKYILKTPIPDTYRGKYTENDGTAGNMYALDAIKEIEESTLPIAAFISEPIVGCGGQVPLAKGYLKEVYPAIRKQGGVCISDEVQTGFGRLGDHFWGFEMQHVIPDIVILGKPMGNGHPMGAVITTSEIAESFGQGVEFFSSFGGNPVSCSIGLSVLEIIEEEKLQENAKIVGDYYKSLLLELQQKYTCIGDVRGSGLFLGVEIVQNDSMDPNSKLAHTLKNELRNNNILISTDGPFNNVLKTKPPLCFTKENALHIVVHLEKVLKKTKTVSEL